MMSVVRERIVSQRPGELRQRPTTTPIPTAIPVATRAMSGSDVRAP